jgi:formamidopyrimidine-DNA glycosylase
VAIKTALLNQTLLAGVGNIYADEALYLSGIRPTKIARTLTAKEVGVLAVQIRSLLARAVKSGGSTINDYLHPDGSLGGFQNWHQVYGKGGEPCPRCDTPITREVIGGRSSHFCRKCQK